MTLLDAVNIAEFMVRKFDKGLRYAPGTFD